MWRLKKKKKKSAGRLDASEGGEDFCWMLFQLSARSRSLLLPLLHKHTSYCVCPSKCFANIPQALKPLKDVRKSKYAATLQLNQGAIIKEELNECKATLQENLDVDKLSFCIVCTCNPHEGC